jgi:predicted nuclease of predicted toxin-antitoxin system
VKLLLDNCVDIRAKSLWPSHEVVHARDLEWRNLSNGKLLSTAAAAGFEAMITVDKNLRFQQNLKTLPVGVIEIDAVRNRLPEIASLAAAVERALAHLQSYRFISVRPDGSFLLLGER